MSKKINNENAEIEIKALSKTEEFFINNRKLLIGIVCFVIVAGVAGFIINKINQSAKNKAQTELAFAEENFFMATDSTTYAAALYGNGEQKGFEEIINEYGNKAGKIAPFYAGICEYELENYENAINYFKSYDGKDVLFQSRALACIADCYVNLEDYNTALGYYDKAIEALNNDLAAEYMFKAGLVCEKLGDNAKALSYYQMIKDECYRSAYALEIEKYISRIEAK